MLALGLAVLLTGAPGAGTAPAPVPDSTFLEQYAATYHFTLGRPTGIKVTPGGDAVLFLRSGPRSFVQDLYSFDIASGRERVLLTAARLLKGGDERLTPEERARRERLRQAARGIASFQISDDGSRVLVPLAGRLFVLERTGKSAGTVREVGGGAGAVIDPQLSPDGARVSYVRDADLYVADVAGGAERRLTEGGCDTLTHGLAEFVAQEEMNRFTGAWWSPDGTRIAYEEANLARVETLHIADPVHPEHPAQSWRYPRAGTANAEVRLGLIAAQGGSTTWVSWDRARYPYLATVRWDKGAPLTLVVQNRRQTEEAVLAVNEQSGATTTLLVERDDAWLNLDQTMPKWLADGSGFLWTTERAGNWQLELRSRTGKLQRALTAPDFGLRRFDHLDDEAHIAWVEASPDPTARNLWRVSLDGRTAPVPFQPLPGLDDATFGKGDAVWVQGHEDPGTTLELTVRRRDGSTVGVLRSVAEKPLITARPRFLQVGLDARHISAVVLTPRSGDPNQHWPVIVSIYGGPTAQTVLQARDRYLLDQWIADHGFVVVTFDGRGTPGRGRAWERAVRGDLVGPMLADQVAALQGLGRTMPELDLDRVGIFGWSFGGYASALAVMKRPDVYRAAVAGAPVTDWHDYDTHYTERYLGLPSSDAEAYERSSVLAAAPALSRPLLIIHGTADDNVYFTHSLKLCDALFRAGKPYEFLPLSGFTHMVPDPVVASRLYGRIVGFFERNLAPAGPTP